MTESIGTRARVGFALILAAVMLSGLAGFWAAWSQSRAMERMQAAATLLRNHMDADMMHDAIRADVLSAIAASKGAPIDIAESRTDLDQHISLLESNIAADRRYTPSPAVRQAAAAVEGDLRDYIATARELVGSADASASLPRFLATFSRLEDGMSKVSDTIETHVKEVNEAARRTATIAIVLIALGIVATMVIIVLIAGAGRRLLVLPLTQLAHAVRRLTGGDLKVEVPSAERGDEIGQLASCVQALRDQLASADAAKAAQARLIVESVGTGLAALARGDLITRIEADLAPPFDKLKHDFNRALMAMSGTVGVVADSSDAMQTVSQEIRRAAQDLAERTERQARSLQTAAAAIQDVAGRVTETASNIGEARSFIADVSTDASVGGEVVSRATAAMDAIEESSTRIASIISLIDGIAFQTNLLALNAGVEAARAGTAGQGFAVVANEVRALAQRSADAANDIKRLISASSEQVAEGVGLVRETGEKLMLIRDKINEVGMRMSDITATTHSQAAALDSINRTTGELDLLTQQNAAVAEQVNGAVVGLALNADRLAEQVGQFVTLRRPGGAAARPAQMALAAGGGYG